MCIHYTSGPGSECKNEQLPWWRDCGFVRLSPRMLEYVNHFFYDEAVAKKDQRVRCGSVRHSPLPARRLAFLCCAAPLRWWLRT